jgi:hypothetical protein
MNYSLSNRLAHGSMFVSHMTGKPNVFVIALACLLHAIAAHGVEERFSTVGIYITRPARMTR